MSTDKFYSTCQKNFSCNDKNSKWANQYATKPASMALIKYETVLKNYTFKF